MVLKRSKSYLYFQKNLFVRSKHLLKVAILAVRSNVSGEGKRFFFRTTERFSSFPKVFTRTIKIFERSKIPEILRCCQATHNFSGITFGTHSWKIHISMEVVLYKNFHWFTLHHIESIKCYLLEYHTLNVHKFIW